jgi:hypothetical protein
MCSSSSLCTFLRLSISYTADDTMLVRPHPVGSTSVGNSCHSTNNHRTMQTKLMLNSPILVHTFPKLSVSYSADDTMLVRPHPVGSTSVETSCHSTNNHRTMQTNLLNSPILVHTFPKISVSYSADDTMLVRLDSAGSTSEENSCHSNNYITMQTKLM